MATPGNKGTGALWKLLYAIIGTIDGIQLIVGWTGIGTAVSEALEVITPFIIIGYCQFVLKVSIITKPKRLISLFAIAGADALTGGIAPFWVIDVWYIQYDVKKGDIEEKETAKQVAMFANKINQPLNEDGIRLPQTEAVETAPINNDGVRMPKRG